MPFGEMAQSRLDEIAKCSQAGICATCRPFTPAHELASDQVVDRMFTAGLRVHMDDAATRVGRPERPAGTKTLLMGTHQESLPNGGRYDGIMGIALDCLALEKLKRDGVTLGYSVDALAFADEEGVRIPTARLGPRVLAGTFDYRCL